MPADTPAQSGAEDGAGQTSLFRQTDFLLYLAGRFFSGISQRMLTVVVGWHVYLITNDPIALGYVGLAAFLPILLLSLVTGEVADRYNRAFILWVSGAGMTLAAVGILILAAADVQVAWPLYALIAVHGTSTAFSRPALISILPNLVSRAQLMDAIAWSSSLMQVSMIAGPAAAGIFLIFGVTVGYAAVVVPLALMTFVWFRLIRYGTVEEVEEVRDARTMITRVFGGIAFIRKTPLILAAISLDMIVVLLGSVIALLPIFAKDILDTGPAGLGAMRAAPAVGAALMAFFIARWQITRHAGPLMLLGTAVFGVATIVFGLSTNLWLSLAALFVTGAGDMVSVIVRNALVQLLTPDALRGRVNAVNMLFISASNELGDFRAGLAAGLLGTIPAVLAGGVITLVATGFSAVYVKSLRTLDRISELEPAPVDGDGNGKKPA